MLSQAPSQISHSRHAPFDAPEANGKAVDASARIAPAEARRRQYRTDAPPPAEVAPSRTIAIALALALGVGVTGGVLLAGDSTSAAEAPPESATVEETARSVPEVTAPTPAPVEVSTPAPDEATPAPATAATDRPRARVARPLHVEPPSLVPEPVVDEAAAEPASLLPENPF